MMRPPIGFWSFMMRKACCVHRKVPWTIEPMTPLHLAHSRSSIWAAAPKPALLNKTSSRPKVALVLANSASTEARSLTSVGTPSVLTCIASISPTTALSGSGRRPATTTAKPSRASASAEALPMPLPPPVTRATLPLDAMLVPPGCRVRHQAIAHDTRVYESRKRGSWVAGGCGGSGGCSAREHSLSRQRHGHAGALAEGAVDRDPAAVQLDDRLAQRQPEAGPLVTARQPTVD